MRDSSVTQTWVGLCHLWCLAHLVSMNTLLPPAALQGRRWVALNLGGAAAEIAVDNFKVHIWYTLHTHHPHFLNTCSSLCFTESSALLVFRAKHEWASVPPADSLILSCSLTHFIWRWERSLLFFYFLLSLQKVDTPRQQGSPQIAKLTSLQCDAHALCFSGLYSCCSLPSLGFQHIFSLITYQVSFHLASWWPHLFHFSFHLSFSHLLKMQQFPNNSCVCCGAVHPTPETQVSSVSYFTALHWRKRQTCPHWTRQTFSMWPITCSVQE